MTELFSFSWMTIVTMRTEASLYRRFHIEYSSGYTHVRAKKAVENGFRPYIIYNKKHLIL